MKLYGLFNQGLQKIAEQEIQELGAKLISSTKSIIEFEILTEEQLFTILYRTQSLRKILLSLGTFTNSENYKFPSLNWESFFKPITQYSIEIEGVKGQENRQKIAKELAPKFFDHLKEKDINLEVNYKEPDLIILVYRENEKYYLGIDLMGIDLSSRCYRTFPHPASIKGDLAFQFLKLSQFKLGNKLLVAYMKDGTIPIEAVLYQHHLPVQSIHENYSFQTFPIWKNYPYSELFIKLSAKKEQEITIHGFDITTQNLVATRKNSSIAKVKEYIKTQKCTLEDIDVKYEENTFDNCIINITKKDEDKINEIYYQMSYILKSQGHLLITSREQWDPSISTKFDLISTTIITRGNSIYKAVLLKLR